MTSKPSDRLTHRFTVALADPAWDALNAERTRTGASQADVINRALLLLANVRRTDGTLMLHPSDGGDPIPLLIL